MQDLASLAVALGIFICHSAALPQDQPPSRVVVNPTLVERDSVRYTGNGIEEQARRENAKHCGEYYPPEGDPGDPNNPQGVQQQCMNVCGNITQETDDDGKAHSVSCISFNQPWVTQDGRFVHLGFYLLPNTRATLNFLNRLSSPATRPCAVTKRSSFDQGG